MSQSIIYTFPSDHCNIKKIAMLLTAYDNILKTNILSIITQVSHPHK